MRMYFKPLFRIPFIRQAGAFLALLSILVTACSPDNDGPLLDPAQTPPVSVEEKVGGVAFVSPRNPISDAEIGYITTSNAGWVQFIPYGFCLPNDPEVSYNPETWWWGESVEGTRFMIRSAHAQGLKILLKPHIWIGGVGWAGNLTMDNEADWLTFESSYQAYIMRFAQIAAEEGVEMFCVGTELKGIVQDRPDYFGRLADSVRTVFNGPVTYAANWDNFEEVEFWDKMDYIGIDAYFPLLEADTPAVPDLIQAWTPTKAVLESYSQRYRLPVLFTEWGYLSVSKCGWRNWELEADLNNQAINLQAQVNCYQAMFETFWEEDWFAGGFSWQWYADHPNAGGLQNRDHTPQNKPALDVLRSWYGD